MMEDLKHELRLEFLYAVSRGVGLAVGVGLVLCGTGLMFVFFNWLIGLAS